MHRLTKLFVLAACLLLIGTAFASQVKGPVAGLIGKNGVIESPAFSGASDYQLPAVGSRRPGSLDEIIISEGFEAYDTGDLPTGWTQVDVDNAACPVPEFEGFSRWIVLNQQGQGGLWPAHTGTKSVANAYNNGAVANNDWLILPQQNLTGTITLNYWASTQDPIYPESFEVRVSTTGNAPANFTNLVATHSGVPQAWTEYTEDLSAFAGAPFYIAFHYISVDMFVFKIDDVVLEGTAGAVGHVAGLVLDDVSGDPLAGVTVSGAGGGGTTDASGNYVFSAPAGTYSITFTKDGYTSLTVPNITVVEGDTVMVDALLAPEAETNDDCDSPLEVTAGDYAFSTAEATVDASIAALPASCNEGFGVAFGPDIWFLYTAPGTGVLEVSTCDQADFDTRMAVYSDGTGSAPACPTTNDDFLGCNDDGAGCGGFTSRLTFNITSGVSYLIRVGGFGTESGTGTVTFTATTDANDAPAIPSAYALHQAYPNPFNPSTQISFDVPATTNATLKVFNSLGQEVATLLDGQVTAGAHTMTFEASSLPSGLYFAQLHAGSFVSTQKLVLMK
ncbi:MAG: choice-of-anchor J domain-containing protein [bacterium]|nr:choice-of-anchor J domain-containing protein [bacterium]